MALLSIRTTNTDQNGDLSETWAIRRRLRDYAAVGRKLFWQRFIIYSMAIFLAGAYYDPFLAAISFGGVCLCEAYDGYAFRQILRRRLVTRQDTRSAMAKIYIGTLASSVTIAMFCISVAVQQGIGTGHFLPLFLLVSAAIFAAMNNHHFLPVLGLRLSIYIAAILFIPLRDVWIVRPPLSAGMWLDLFTVLFVLGFLLELSRSFLVGYSAYLTSRKELEDEHKRTKAAYEAKTRFLATVSHELRTPLTSIKGALEMINTGQLGEPPDKMVRLLEMATRNSVRLSDLVGDLLFLQSAEVGKIEYNLQRIDMNALVTEGINQFQPYAAKAKVEIVSETIGDDYFIVGDKSRIEQVLTNLLSNAAKFSDKQSTIYVCLERVGDALRLKVRDEGIGIPDGSEHLVFEEFTQLDGNDNRKFDGTGLGLSISKRIIEAHGGKISYTSQVGVGTTFVIELEATPAPELSLPDENGNVHRLKSEPNKNAA